MAKSINNLEISNNSDNENVTTDESSNGSNKTTLHNKIMNTIKLNLRVEITNKILNKLKLNEKPNINKLKLLMSSNLLKKEFNNEIVGSMYENELHQLKSFYKLIKKGSIDVLYNLSKRNNFGRVYPYKSLGAVGLRREIRHTLYNDNYIDIDVVNCHPVLLLQICKNNNIYHKYLKKYVTNRKIYLDEIISEYNVTRDAAKSLFIQLLYFGGFDSWFKANNIGNHKPTKFMIKFKQELAEIGEYIINANPDISKSISKDKSTSKGSIVSFVLQEYECQILEVVYLYCIKHEYITNNNASLCYDGLMIPKENYKLELLHELEAEVYNRTGFKLSFIQKDMNEGYTDEQLKESQIEAIKDDVEGVYNDLAAARKVYELYPHFICCHSVLYVFDDATGLYTDKEEIIFSIVARFTDQLYVLIETKDGNIKKTNRGYGDSTALKRQMIPELKSLCVNNNWITNTQFTSIGYLLFQNGYYNMKSGIFQTGFNPNIVFTYKIYRNYDTTHKNIEYITDVKDRFIYNQLGQEVGDFFILNLARGLAGDMMKKFFLGLGSTNAGKSTIVKACLSSFGEYIGSFNAENICFRNSSADEAAQMRWIYLLKNKRIIFSNEIKMTSEINGNMIKKVSSKGDTLIARVHGGLETEFVPHFLGVTFANDAPKISGIDTDPAINDRLKVISYTKKYVKEPSNEFELKIDDNIDIEIDSIEFQEAFQFVLLDAYLNYIFNGKPDIEPDEVKNFKSEWVGDGGEGQTISKFLEEFEITDNVEHFTFSKDIENWLVGNKIGLTPTKFAMELKKYCTIKKYKNIESKNKKSNGKVLKAWFGIKTVDNDSDDDD